MELMTADLSEPYSIFTYRYFINNWPDLCISLVLHDEEVPASPPPPHFYPCCCKIITLGYQAHGIGGYKGEWGDKAQMYGSGVIDCCDCCQTELIQHGLTQC